MKTGKDLVWLAWNGSTYFPTLRKKVPKDVVIDMANGSWTFRRQTIKFGRAIENPWKEEGTPLGAYDRTDFHHLQNMLVDYRRLAPPLSVSTN